MFGDIRDLTLEARIDIGFINDRSWWREAPARFSEHALEIAGHSVMGEWERDYMRTLAERLLQRRNRLRGRVRDGHFSRLHRIA